MEPESPRARWRKATRSQGNGACVEVADNVPGRVGMRDSKDPDSGEVWVALDEFRAFLRSVKTGMFA